MAKNSCENGSAGRDAEQVEDNQVSRERLYHLVYGFGVSLIFSVADFAFLWPENHFFALLFFASVLCLLAFYEMRVTYEIPQSVWAATAVLICAAIGFIYWIVGPIPPPPPEIGWLQPANEPTPPNGCENLPPEQVPLGDRLVVLFGDNGMTLLNGASRFDALTVGACPVLSIIEGANGILVDAQLNGLNGASLGTITANKFSMSNDSGLTIEKMGDLSGLVVHDRGGRELLFVRVLNPRTVRIRGVSSCGQPRPTSVEITDTSLANSKWHHTCFAGVGRGVLVQ